MSFVERAKALRATSNLTVMQMLYDCLSELITVVEAAQEAKHNYFHGTPDERLNRINALDDALFALDQKANSGREG